MPLLAFPSDDVIWDATLSMTNEDGEYPVENAQNHDPADTAKATGQSTVVTVDLAAAETIVAAAVFNTNATSIAVSSDAGAIGSITVPTRTRDGKQVDGFGVFSGANRTDDRFFFTLSKGGAAQLEFGRLCLVIATDTVSLVTAGAGPHPRVRIVRPGQVENITRLGTTHRRQSPNQFHRLTATVIDASEFAVLKALAQECLGLGRGFFFVLDENVNEAWFSQLSIEDFGWSLDEPLDDPAVLTVNLAINQIANGLPPELT